MKLTGPFLRLPRIAAALLVVTLVGMCSTRAMGQEKFTLTGDQWQKHKSYPPGSPQYEFQQIRKKLAQGDADTAQSMAEDWLKNHPTGTDRAEALLLAGDAKVAQAHYYDALYDYEQLVRAFPESDQFDTALDREYQIARLFVHGMKRLFLGMRILPADGDGEELLIRIQERAPGSAVGEKASLELADYYYRDDEMANAAEAYDLFLQNYPQSPHREWAMLRLIHASLAKFRGPGFDPTGLLDAQQRLKRFKEEYPAAAEKIGAEALLVRIHESLAMNDYQTAQWYRGQGKDVSAVVLLRRLVQEYPQTGAAKKAIDDLKQMHAAVVVHTDAAAHSTQPATGPSEKEDHQ